MKYVKTLTLTAAVVLTSVTGMAWAGETALQAPEINNKLEMMVKEKMDALVRDTKVNRENSNIATGNDMDRAPAVTQESSDSTLADIRTKIL